MDIVKGQPFGVQRSPGMRNRYQTYFAAPDGSSTYCSRGAPGSIYQAIAAATTPGDTIILLGGRYDISATNVVWGSAGTADAPIITQAEEGEEVVLQAESLAYDTARTASVTAAYNILKGFRIEHMPRAGITVSADNAVLDGIEAVGCGQYGIVANNSGDIKNCVVASCGKEAGHSGVYIGAAASLRIANTVSCYNGVHGFHHAGTDGGVEYVGCMAYGNENHGWLAHNGATFRQSVAFDNGADGFNCGASATTTKFNNCTSWRNTGVGFAALASGTALNGCISYLNSADKSGSAPTESDNSWDLATNPDFFSTTVGEEGFLLPAPDSLMVHMGAYGETYRG